MYKSQTTNKTKIKQVLSDNTIKSRTVKQISAGIQD